MQPWMKVLRNITWLVQLGLSIIVPPLLCIGGCYWLQNRFSLGSWVMLPGIILGLGGSVSSAFQFYRLMRRQAERDSQHKPDAFNNHE